MLNETSSESLTATLAKKNSNVLEQNLAAFAHRFPVSGRIVHALAQEFGGVAGLAEKIERSGLGEAAQGWVASARPSPLEASSMNDVLGAQVIELVSQHLAIPRESVEIQAALGIPKFFSSLGQDDDLDLGYSLKKYKKSKVGSSRVAKETVERIRDW